MVVLFFLLWLLMAGEVTLHSCLWGAAASALMAWFCRKVLGYRWRLTRRGLGHLGRMASYCAYLLWQMLLAGFAVMRLIYRGDRDLRPKLIWFDTPLRSERDRAVLANSITLTAGTITVEAEDGRLCVHALDASLARDIENSPFQQRLERLEE